MLCGKEDIIQVIANQREDVANAEVRERIAEQLSASAHKFCCRMTQHRF